MKSSNRCPDEKGTERHCERGKSNANDSSNRCPDEKGTERLEAFNKAMPENMVATVAPMKRGLKVR